MKTPKLKKPRTPRIKAIKVPETDIHIDIARLLRLAAPKRVMWWHTPNGEKRSKAAAGKLKAMGVKAGVPDFLLYDRMTGYLHCMEIKSRDGHLSDSQRGWMTLFSESPTGRYAVVRSIDEANQVLQEWWPKDVRHGPAGLITPGGGFIPANPGPPGETIRREEEALESLRAGLAVMREAD